MRCIIEKLQLTVLTLFKSTRHSNTITHIALLYQFPFARMNIKAPYLSVVITAMTVHGWYVKLIL